jgi:hypothetical protein
MRDLMVANAAPAEQFERMGLPPEGPLTHEHLLCRTQAHLVDTARELLSCNRFPHVTSRRDHPIATLRRSQWHESSASASGRVGRRPLPDVLHLGLVEVAGIAVGRITSTLHAILPTLPHCERSVLLLTARPSAAPPAAVTSTKGRPTAYPMSHPQEPTRGAEAGDPAGRAVHDGHRRQVGRPEDEGLLGEVTVNRSPSAHNRHERRMARIRFCHGLSHRC